MKNIKSLLEKIGELEEKLGYSFNDKDNVVLALTHSSYANELKNHKLDSNERLEFLGDAVLNISISEKIYTCYTQLAEGELTKVRASIVCEPSLLSCSNRIGIGEYMLLGKGEEITGGRTRVSILSDAFEAIIGAIYIDGGLEAAKAFIYRHMEKIIEDSSKGIVFVDYKTQLQEEMQKNAECNICYEIVDEMGPDHNKVFVSQVKVNGKLMGIGEGRSKKEAEQTAARAALTKTKEGSQR